MGAKKVKNGAAHIQSTPVGHKFVLWTIDDLQAFLRLPKSTTYLLVAEGKIPCIKLGKHRRFNPTEVELALKRLPK